MKRTVIFIVLYFGLNCWSCKDIQVKHIISKEANETSQEQISEIQVDSIRHAEDVQNEIIDPNLKSIINEIEEETGKNDQGQSINKPKRKQKKVVKKARINFSEELYDFGEILEGDIVEHKFLFHNAGNAPLMIKTATASCGCTIPSYPYVEIEPGKKGYIGVHYNSIGKSGEQSADITITTNGKPEKINLKMRGTVKPKDN